MKSKTVISTTEKKNRGMFKTIKYCIMSTVITFMISLCTICASADEGVTGSTSDTAWSQVKTFLSTWVLRLGGAVIVVGLIFFGMGFLRDDPDSRSRGIQVVIGGAIVAAVAGLVGTFM